MAKSTTKKSTTKKTTAKSKAVKPAKKAALKAQPKKGTKKAKSPASSTVTKASAAKTPAVKTPAPAKGYGKKDLDFFRTIILEKRKEILEELSTLRESMMDSTTGEYTNENPTYSTHMEQGTDTMEREKTFLFASRESKFLNYLEDALRRIEAGNYGRCNSCGKLIEKERLEAVPHAQQCLNCKLQKAK